MLNYRSILLVIIALILLYVLIYLIASGLMSNNRYRSTNRFIDQSNDQLDDSNNPVQSGEIVALLELTGDGWTQHDNAVRIELEMTHPDVIILDTQSSPDITLQLLTEQYDRGIRKFIGGSRSTILSFIRPYIIEHPDIIFTSVGSTAIPLAQVDNIYRIVAPDSNIPIIAPSFFARDGISSNDGSFEIVERGVLGDVEFVYFFTQIGDEWTESTTEILIPALNAQNIQTAVSYIDITQSEQEIGAQLEQEIPTLPDKTVFMAYIAGNDNQKFYSSLQYSPKAKMFNHYAGDATAFFTFTGAAVQQALDVNLRAYSYVPDSTPASVTLTENTERQLGEFVHPFSVISVDTITALKQTTSSDQMLSVLDNTYGITGSLASNMNGDRITGQYIWFHYHVPTESRLNFVNSSNSITTGDINQPAPNNEVDGIVWSPDFIMGRSLQYGDYAGPFVTLS